MSGPTALLPFQPATMTSAQLAAVSYLAGHSGRTHSLYAYQLLEWFSWRESNGMDPGRNPASPPRAPSANSATTG